MSKHLDAALAAIDECLALDFTSDLPTRTPSQELSALGHPGYSDAFASQALKFIRHGMQPHAAVQATYNHWR
jgi:hypothetical protein